MGSVLDWALYVMIIVWAVIGAFVAGLGLTESKIIRGWTLYLTRAEFIIACGCLEWARAVFVVWYFWPGKPALFVLHLGTPLAYVACIGIVFGIIARYRARLYRKRKFGTKELFGWRRYLDKHPDGLWTEARFAPSAVRQFITHRPRKTITSIVADLFCFMALPGLVLTTVVAQMGDKETARKVWW